MQGRIERTLVPGRLLEDNVLGDPSERELILYLPPGYDGRRRFPTVMVLPGFGSTNQSLLNYEVFQPTLFQRFDRMLAEGRCEPALLVLPDAINRWGGSQYLDSPASGRYQSYLADEVVPFVDARYATIPTREARAVVGKSSGGFGALRLGLDRPDVFAAIGSHAGDSAFDLCMPDELRAAAIRIGNAGGIESFLRDFPPKNGLGAGDFDAIMMIACAAAYSPNMRAPWPHLELPIDLRTGELRADVWARWVEHDPVVRLDRDETALRSMRWVFLDAGDRDEHGLQMGARRMADRLRARGVALQHEEFAGGHRRSGHRYETSLTALIAHLEHS